MRHKTRRRDKTLASAALLAGILSAATAPTYASEDLLFHYRLAVRNDPKLRSAEANRNAVGERRAQSQAAFLPNISATAARSRNTQEVATTGFIFSQPAGKAIYTSNEYRLSLSQPLYHAELLAGYQVANADLRQAEAQYVAAVHEVMLRTAQAYFDVLLAQDTLSFARAEKDALAHQLESARARLKSGLAPITDVHDAEAGLQNALSQEITAQNQLADKREALAEITGKRPDILAALGEKLAPVLPDPPDIDQWTQTAVEQNPAVQTAKAAMESARAAIAQNRAGHYPSLDLVGSIARDSSDVTISGPGVTSDNSSVGLQLKIPLYQGGLIYHRGQEAAYRYEAARQELEARRRNVERTTRAAFQSVNGGMAKIQALEQTVKASSASLAARSEGYRAGLSTTLDVLNITRDLSRARRDLAEARYGYVLALVQLKQAAGTLNEEDMLAVNGWLQP